MLRITFPVAKMTEANEAHTLFSWLRHAKEELENSGSIKVAAVVLTVSSLISVFIVELLYLQKTNSFWLKGPNSVSLQ